LIEEEVLVFVPNSFTPDGDEFNNIFLPLISGNFDTYAYTLLIFNRWGGIVFESRNAEIGWDGTYGGLYAPDGVYTWLIKLKTKSTDRVSEYTGHVVLMR
jgi:gliding motility-associated-like protein